MPDTLYSADYDFDRYAADFEFDGYAADYDFERYAADFEFHDIEAIATFKYTEGAVLKLMEDGTTKDQD